jgi:dihydropteroate synthase
MAIINVTPDSFSDGGDFYSVDAALRRADQAISEGADILDIGGESTRPGSGRVPQEEEVRRVIPVIEAVSKRFDIAVSVDTWKAEVARRAVGAGAEIVNDISGLRWEPELASVAAATGSGLVLMHSLGEFETMHSQQPVIDIFLEIEVEFGRATAAAAAAGVKAEQMVLDVGIGFGKSFDQNLELLANLNRVVDGQPDYPVLVGGSRKSFIGKILNGAPPEERLGGSIAAAALAVWNGAKIVRVHDVKQTVEAVRTADAVLSKRPGSSPIA